MSGRTARRARDLVRHDAEDLWRRFGAGDGAAFAELYRDHEHDVLRYCQSLLHHEEDARDAAQGTWTSLWNAPAAARRDVPLRPWLFRVAHNESVSILRRRRRHDELGAVDVAAPGDLEGDVELRDRMATLRADLGTLPERQRAALLLREVSGLGHAEIGAAFGISPAAARQTIYEARQALAEAEGGRSMDCDAVRRAISDGDGRVRRGRRLRAHLRGCAACRQFSDTIVERGHDLRALIPAPAAAGWLARLAAAGGASSGAVATGGSLGGALAAKVALVTAAVVTAGVGAQHATAHHHRAAGLSAGAAPAAARPAVPAHATRQAPAADGPRGAGRSRASATPTVTGGVGAPTTATARTPTPAAVAPAAVAVGRTPGGAAAASGAGTGAPSDHPNNGHQGDAAAASGKGQGSAGHDGGAHAATPHTAGAHATSPHDSGSPAPRPHATGPHATGPHAAAPHDAGAPHGAGAHPPAPHAGGNGSPAPHDGAADGGGAPPAAPAAAEPATPAHGAPAAHPAAPAEPGGAGTPAAPASPPGAQGHGAHGAA
jgi:RNA polymerase sigma factor (sigma-70 family)